MEDQILDELIKEWLDKFEVNSHSLNEIKSRAQDSYAQVKKIKVNMLAPSLDEVWNTRLRLKEINSKGLNLLYF